MEQNFCLFLTLQATYFIVAYALLRGFGNKLWTYLLICVVYPPFTISSIFWQAKSAMNALGFLSFSVFIFGVLLLTVCAWYSRKNFKALSICFASIAAILLVVGIEGFVIEPHWLTIRRETMKSSKLKHPLKVAVIADIQTDDVCGYDFDALMHVKEYNPDLVLFAGDYINVYNDDRPRQIQLLNDTLKRVGLTPPIGVFIVKGDIDAPDWMTCFKNLPYQITETSKTGKYGDIVVTQLSLQDSRTCKYKFAKTEEFHIALGHAPDYALTNPPVDLIVAGHTHGGQVQLPFFGPLITYSDVPREWAGGCMTDIGTGTMLCISRGVGMERCDAPRIRFFCRPELVFIDVLPE
ncbi:MAG: metallophosphoesterase [Candidatus Obscuribacterales bacterium]|nr:metallophosphoesterase [Candidatus Obscuribacterales bacterium]